jgi:hypothetical protein
MSITDIFRNNVSNRNIQGIRVSMKNSLLTDRTFKVFDEMERCALQKISETDLYDDYDGCEFKSESNWNIDYMNDQMVEVVDHFSKERLAHLKKVVQKLYLADVRQQTKSSYQEQRPRVQPTGSYHQEQRPRVKSPGSNYQEQKRRDQLDGNYRGVKIGMGAVVGGVAGGVIASVTGHTIGIGVVVGSVVLGLFVAGGTKGEKKYE